MNGIPEAKDTDAEDVAWGLQTADALWKRGERIDAIVWLRRAAQSAGDASDDDRALELARHAAELSDWVASEAEGPGAEPARGVQAPTVVPSGVDPLASVEVDLMTEEGAETLVGPRPPEIAELVNALAPGDDGEPRADAGAEAEGVEGVEGAEEAEEAEEPPPSPPRAAAPSSPTIQTDPSILARASEHLRAARRSRDAERESSPSVLPAERVHAGMLDPWGDAEARGSVVSPPTDEASVPASSPPTSDDEIVTSVRPQAHEPSSSSSIPLPASERIAVSPPPPRLPAKPPPLPPRARAAKPPALPPAAAVDEPPPSAELIEDVAASAEESVAGGGPADGGRADDQGPPGPLDLEEVEAFADLPDDARADFAAAATLEVLAEGEEVSGFALAYVVSGTFDVAATMVDAPALRLEVGGVLRTRGTTDEDVPMRLIGVGSRSVVATWGAASVASAMGTCPWVEDDLRAAADRVLAVVGITIGPLGERIDVSIREQIVSRLTMRSLAPGEVVVTAGEPVPGLILVGVGELELLRDDEPAGAVGSGDFLFAGEVLGAGPAPMTARAGRGGALVMFGDRMIAQELLVTCPPLLEVFAGM